MTKSEWLESEDAGAMIEYLWQRRGVSPRTQARELLKTGGLLRGLRDDLPRALRRPDPRV